MVKESSEKLPPQNTEAEQCLLGCLMLDKDAIVKVVDYIKAEDFYKSIHQDIYQKYDLMPSRYVGKSEIVRRF